MRTDLELAREQVRSMERLLSMAVASCGGKIEVPVMTALRVSKASSLSWTSQANGTLVITLTKNEAPMPIWNEPANV